ncbi:hypothetical protein MPER_12537 [Moniliophthora perniciosa FA553]|nr:hypothetical protein MPER_12537 [Moniliophthora perniciosa FA553]
MFARAAAFTLATSAIFAAASPVPGGSGSCNTGPVQCCNSVQAANSPAAAGLIGLLGVVVQDVTAQMHCSQTVCCENNSFNGIIAVGCTPINIGL